MEGLLPKQFEYHGPPKKCPQCGEEFMPNTVRQVYDLPPGKPTLLRVG